MERSRQCNSSRLSSRYILIPANPMELPLDENGQILLNRVSGFETALVADTGVFLVLEYLSAEHGKASHSIPFVLTVAGTVSLAARLTELAELAMLPSDKPPN